MTVYLMVHLNVPLTVYKLDEYLVDLLVNAMVYLRDHLMALLLEIRLVN